MHLVTMLGIYMETLAGTNSPSRNHLWVLEFGVFTDSQLAKEGLHK